MTIPFACRCGQQLSARDEHAGLQVRCTACGQVQTVPASAAPKPQAVAGMIQLTCGKCGKSCQASSEHAGKQTKCPGCGALLTITPPMATRLPDSYSPSQPARQAGPRRDIPWKWVGAGVGALVVLLVVVWFVFLRKSGGPDGGTSVADFDLVPRNAEGFATFRVADAMKTAPGKRAWETVRQQAGPQLEELEKKAGLTAADIERVTYVAADIEKEAFWLIIHTSKPYDQNRILSWFTGATERTHEGRKYHAKGNGGLLFVNDRQLVIGTEVGVQRCLEQPKKPASGPLDEAITLALDSKYHLVLGSSLPQDKIKEAAKEYRETLEQLQVKNILDARTLHATGILNEQMEFEVWLSYADDTKAKKVQEEMTKGLGQVQFLLGLAKGQIKEAVGKGGDQVVEQLDKALKQLKPRQEGNKVTLNLKLESAPLLKFLDEQLEELKK